MQVRSVTVPLNVRDGSVVMHHWIPSRDSGRNPVLFLCGWGKTHDSYLETIAAWVDAGRHVYTLTWPSDDLPAESNRPPWITTRVRAIFALLDQFRISRPMDVIAHSEGGLYALLAAADRPVRFGQLVLYGPPGVAGPQSWGSILWNVVIRNEIHNVLQGLHASPAVKARLRRGASDIKKWQGRRGALRAIREGLSAGRQDVRAALRQLGEQGRRVIVFAGENDCTFPLQSVQNERLPVDLRIVDDAEHETPFLYPESYALPLLKALRKAR